MWSGGGERSISKYRAKTADENCEGKKNRNWKTQKN